MSVPTVGWGWLEKTAFGLIYASIVVLSLLMALGGRTGAPFDMAIVLFGSVLAITLAKIFADLLSHAIETGQRILTRQSLTTAWRDAHPALSVVNLPTALFIGSGLGWMHVETAVTVSQLYCIAILVVLGARMGWVISRGPWLSIAGAVSSGGIGCALAALKYAIH